MALTKTHNRMIAGAPANVKDFGAVGDGVTDDTAAIQAAIEHCFTLEKDIVFSGSDNYKITSSLLLPQRPVGGAYSSIKVEGNNCTITTTGSLSVFESAYDNAGTLQSSAYTSNDTYMSFGVVVQNFNIVGDGTSTLPAIAINSYHQGCMLLDVNSKGYDYFLYAQNCYYSRFHNLLTTGAKSSGVARFVFNSNNNLMSMTNLVAVNSNIGYKFEGLVDAVDFNNNSIEGVDTGILFTGDVRSISITNNYIEAFTDVAIDFTSNVYAANIDNNYVNNTSNAFFLDYNPAPNNNITVGKGNDLSSVTDDKLFKSLDNTAGYSAISYYGKPKYAFNNDDFLLDNTNFSNQLIYNQVLNQAGLKANVVNKYAPGFYSGQYTDGYARSNGFEFVSTGTSTLQLDTKFTSGTTTRIYVNLKISASGLYYRAGELVNHGNVWRFYEYDGTTGMVLSTNLSASIVGGFVRISGTLPATVTACVGEVRLA